jgi:ACS family glucarate transporter-like MFS transporter
MKTSETGRPTRVRWKILVLLVGFSVTSYIMRVNISIAGDPIMRESHLTPVQLGWIFSAFGFSYTLFMTPAGVYLDRYGTRIILAACGISWALLSLFTAVTPNIIFTSTMGIIISLATVRAVLGICQTPVFPGGAKAISEWFPDRERAFATGCVQTGALLGTAVTAPLITYLMVHMGWRQAMVMTSVLAPSLALVWLYYATDRPHAHPGINAAELAVIGLTPAEREKLPGHELKTILKSGQAWMLTIAYGCESYASYMFIWWIFIYLVQVRKFGVLGSGFIASIPFIVATITTPLAGSISDKLTLRLGPRRGRRIVPLVTLPAAAILISFGARVPGPTAAVIILSLGAALSLAAEGPTWATMSEMSGPSAGAATGFVNTGSNLGGTLSTLLTPWIAVHFSWPIAFGVASFFALAGAALWAGVDATHRLGKPTVPAVE